MKAGSRHRRERGHEWKHATPLGDARDRTLNEMPIPMPWCSRPKVTFDTACPSAEME